jgi:predicted amidophosphoribosyltransferase
LRGSPPPGLRDVVSAAPNEGVARELVAALKYRRLVQAVEPMGERLAAVAPAATLRETLVPVPASPLRMRIRGFDPAAELALALARRGGAEPDFCLARRGSGRQVGRGRRERIGSPPEVRVTRPAPGIAVLIDDVMTTGATLAACALSLRRAGCVEVRALTFAREI